MRCCSAGCVGRQAVRLSALLLAVGPHALSLARQETDAGSSNAEGRKSFVAGTSQVGPQFGIRQDVYCSLDCSLCYRTTLTTCSLAHLDGCLDGSALDADLTCRLALAHVQEGSRRHLACQDERPAGSLSGWRAARRTVCR